MHNYKSGFDFANFGSTIYRNGYLMAVIMDMEPESYSMDTLEQYQYGTSAEYQIYNAETNMLYIEDVTDLTIPEMQCILACRTNNPSLNSFAGEIVFHAKMAIVSAGYEEVSYQDILGWFSKNAAILNYLIGEGIDSIYSSAISADMAVGSVGRIREELVDSQMYKEYDSACVITQREIWGDM